jgi:hypothetical protein
MSVHPTITMKLAQTRQEFEGAFRLLQRSRAQLGWEKNGGDLWLLKHHALPSTNTIVAMEGEQVLAAICLFGDSAYRLPIEAHLNLNRFRENLEGRLGELSLPAFHPDYASSEDLRLALYHYAHCFGATYCLFEGFVTEIPVNQAGEYTSVLGFERIFEPLHERQVIFLNAREGRDFRSRMGESMQVEFRFPEKKSFLVAHQSMEPAVMSYLFNERTQLFSRISDFELRVLKNIYDYGDYKNILPARSLAMPEKRSPRYPRFPMTCEGYIVNQSGQRENVQVLDVSREGLKLRSRRPLERGETYMLTILVGVNKQAELIASAIWVDDLAEMAGFEIKSKCRHWQQLIEYLEKDFLRIA